MARMEKINSQMRREIATILRQEFGDQRLHFVAVTRADVSPDLRNAKIYFTSFNEQNAGAATEDTLKRVSGMIRKHLARRMDLRYTPFLDFIYDTSVEKGIRLEETLQEIKNEKNFESD